MSPHLPSDLLLGPAADETFAALADRTRRRILVRLSERPDDAGAVARDLDLSRQAVAKHLRVLEGAGIVRADREVRRRVHQVDADRLREISDLLGVVARGWDRRLAGIATEAERRERESAPGSTPDAADVAAGTPGSTPAAADSSPARGKSVRIPSRGDEAAE